MIAFNRACYASVTGRMEEAKVRPWHAIELDKEIRRLASTMKTAGPCGIGLPVWSNISRLPLRIQRRLKSREFAGSQGTLSKRLYACPGLE
jgi:hypothetical protein